MAIPMSGERTLDLPFEFRGVELETKADGSEVGTFTGLAAAFGNRDLVNDVIEPGAFAKSLANPRAIKMLWSHDVRAPIGVWADLRETKAGLEVKGELILEVQQAREALALMKAGALDALSIGFRVPKGGATIDRDTGTRRLKEIELLEISLVTFPANPQARVTGVKAQLDAGELPSERDMERLLRQAGLSQREAKAFVAGGYRAFAERRDPDTLDGELLDSIRRAAAVWQ